jgi:hypothetical protein
MGRGIEKRKIFVNDKDRMDFIYRLAGDVEKGERIYFSPTRRLYEPEAKTIQVYCVPGG